MCRRPSHHQPLLGILLVAHPASRCPGCVNVMAQPGSGLYRGGGTSSSMHFLDKICKRQSPSEKNKVAVLAPRTVNLA